MIIYGTVRLSSSAKITVCLIPLLSLIISFKAVFCGARYPSGISPPRAVLGGRRFHGAALTLPLTRVMGPGGKRVASLDRPSLSSSSAPRQLLSTWTGPHSPSGSLSPGSPLPGTSSLLLAASFARVTGRGPDSSGMFTAASPQPCPVSDCPPHKAKTHPLHNFKSCIPPPGTYILYCYLEIALLR